MDRKSTFLLMRKAGDDELELYQWFLLNKTLTFQIYLTLDTKIYYKYFNIICNKEKKIEMEPKE